MRIETQYSYEKKWTLTSEIDILRIIQEELGETDTKGVLAYIKESIANKKVMSVGSCRFRVQLPQN